MGQLNERSAEELLASVDAPAVDVPVALARFRGVVTSRGVSAASSGRSGWFSRVARLPRLPVAVAATLVLVIAFGATGLADSFLTIFQPQRFATVQVTPGDMRGLPDLSAYGTMSEPTHGPAVTVADAAAASAAAGFTVLTPARLPGAATGGRFQVVPRTTATFTFSAEAARATAATAGRTAPPIPAGIDGTTLLIEGGPTVLQTYGAQPADGTMPANMPTLVVAQARVPSVNSNGASFEQVRDYLLAQPGVSPVLAAELRAVSDPTRTLPIPVPAGQANSKTVAVHGSSGVFVGDSTGIGSAVIWQQGGIVFGLAGTLTEDELIATANSLR